MDSHDDDASRANKATGRNRQIASLVILERLRELVREAEFIPLESGVGVRAEITCNRLNIRFWRNRLGLYVGVDRGPGQRLLMSGYIDPVEPGRYADVQLDTMTWLRGWEAELFSPLQ